MFLLSSVILWSFWSNGIIHHLLRVLFCEPTGTLRCRATLSVLFRLWNGQQRTHGTYLSSSGLTLPLLRRIITSLLLSCNSTSSPGIHQVLVIRPSQGQRHQPGISRDRPSSSLICKVSRITDVSCEMHICLFSVWSQRPIIQHDGSCQQLQ